MPRLLVADGSSQIHRTYHALARQGTQLTAADGTPTGALLPFLNVLRKAVRQHQPTHLAVTFDRGGRTFRHDLFPDYKAQRDKTPEDLLLQLDLAREALAALRIPVLEEAGWEADDLIATLVARARAAGWDVVILSSDKDLMQLVEPGVVLHHSMRDQVMDEKAVEEYFEVPPHRVADVLAIQGDASDNIPGVRGIGEKGATDLVKRHGDVDSILAHLAEVEADEGLGRLRKRLASLLKEQADDARRSKQLVLLRTDAPLPQTLDDLVLSDPDAERTRPLFQRLGFTRLLAELKLADTATSATPASEPGAAPSAAAAVAAVVAEAPARTLKTARDVEAIIAAARATGRLALVVLPAPAATSPQGSLDFGARGAHVVGLAARAEDPAWLPLDDALTAPLAHAASHGDFEVVGHDLKAALRRIGHAEPPWPARLFDSLIASQLLDWPRRSHALPALVTDVLGLPALDAARSDAAAQSARAALLLRDRLHADVEALGLASLSSDIEMPLVPLLAEMEQSGIALDPAALEELRQEMQQRLDHLTRDCHALAGCEFNVASPKQLGEVLFQTLGLASRGRTAKTKVPSTASDVLEQLVDEHPVVAKVLEHRELSKLLGTYIEVLPGLADAGDHRVRTTWNQVGAETGRLSSTDPNLQNIPSRTELGRRIRRAFIAGPGCLLVGADYSQVELRIMAHVSADEALCEAFARGEDIHRATAAKMFKVMPELVTSEMRDRAKVINFGVIYGMTAHGVAQRLRCSRAEGQALIDGYFGAYPRMRTTVDRLIEEVRAHPRHEARTLFGRVRFLEEIVSRNQGRRQFAERAAVNSVIQGTAADLMKLGMLAAHRTLRERFPEARLLLQVHDELVAECPERLADEVLSAMIAAMEGVFPLRAPLQAKGGKGRTWYDLK
jgi:DNA polymerase-1